MAKTKYAIQCAILSLPCTLKSIGFENRAKDAHVIIPVVKITNGKGYLCSNNLFITI